MLDINLGRKFFGAEWEGGMGSPSEALNDNFIHDITVFIGIETGMEFVGGEGGGGGRVIGFVRGGVIGVNAGKGGRVIVVL